MGLVPRASQALAGRIWLLGAACRSCPVSTGTPSATTASCWSSAGRAGGAIRKEDSRHQMYDGNMRELNRSTFRCRKCGGTEIRAYVPNDHDDVDMFLAGDPVGTMRQAI